MRERTGKENRSVKYGRMTAETRSLNGSSGAGKKSERRMGGRIGAAALALLLTLAAGISGCGKARPPKLSESTEELSGQYERAFGKDKAVQHMAASFESQESADTFRQSYTDFSLRLLRESRAREKQQNTMVSPLSVMTALEMARSGAGGETESQMARTLYGEALPEEAKEELLAYLKALPNGEGARFRFANSVWFRTPDPDFTVDEKFLENSAGNYGADIFGSPFDDNTLADINRWVEEETDGMIKDILEEISQDAVLYLINAMAFDAKWQEPYEAYQIHEAEFFPEEGEPQTVEMMYSMEGQYIQGESVSGFVKPYKEGYAFAALLPAEGINVDDYLVKLTGEDFMELLENARETMVDAGLPKFTGETQLTLNEILKSMGMSAAFEAERADFGKMAQYADGNIYIGKVVHNTFIQVDELGTQAGAATVVEMESGGAAVEMVSVILNRPFIYAIVDTEAKLPIFLGIMENADGR